MKKRLSVKKLKFKKINVVNFNAVYGGNSNVPNTGVSLDTTCYPVTSYDPQCPYCPLIN